MITMPHWPPPLWHREYKRGTERIKILLAQLGNPECRLPPVVHVAGTNGKGSTIAFMRAILEAAGYKVHCYTSPHLIRFNERIRLAGRLIDDLQLKPILERCRHAAEQSDVQVTFFEGTTAAAFVAMAETPADIVLLETGMGGLYDATNVIERPALTVITPISYDHMEYLGPTLTSIATEKAGIMKPGTLCVTSYQAEEVELALQHAASRIPVPLCAFGYDYGIRPLAQGLQFESEHLTLTLPFPNLPGEHQYINAATAIASCSLLRMVQLREEHYSTGITTAAWPARLQRLMQGNLVELLPAGWEVWLDGAHNTGGAYTLGLWAEQHQDKPLYILCGMTKGRDIAAFLAPLVPYVKAIGGFCITAEPSSYPADAIVKACEALQVPATAFATLEEALSTWSANASQGRILFCGSLYLSGMAFEANGDVLK